MHHCLCQLLEEIYAQIEKDAKEAITGLLDKSDTGSRSRHFQAPHKMLLANLYITQKKWPQAEPLLKEIVASGKYALMPDYNDAFSTTEKRRGQTKTTRKSLSKSKHGRLVAGYRWEPDLSLHSPCTDHATTENPVLSITWYFQQTKKKILASGKVTAFLRPILSLRLQETGDKEESISIGYVTLSGSRVTNKTYPYGIKKYARTAAFACITTQSQKWPVYRYAEVLLFRLQNL